jgi:prefoldin subunit 5
MTAETEMEWLKDQAESIKQEIDHINARISELQKE